MAEKLKCAVIIPAGGVGTRFGGQIPKQYTNVLDIPIIIRTIQLFDSVPLIDTIVIAIDPEWLSFVDNKILKHKIKKSPVYVSGGKERQSSVYNCLFVEDVINSDIILVHDAVRPCASQDLVTNVIMAAQKYGAVIPALKTRETIKLVDENGIVDKTIPRSKLRHAQTPQGFKTNIFINAYKKAVNSFKVFTDDASIMEFSGHKVHTIEGEDSNIKITTPFDSMIAETFFVNRDKIFAK